LAEEGQRRGYKLRTGKVSDPNAGWSVKKNTQGKTTYIFGYKAHLLVDCEYELPIAANISAGNILDGTRASDLLSEARWTYRKFRPKFVIADTGCSGKPFLRLIKRQYRAQPIISVNPTHKKLMAEFRAAMETPEWKALYGQRQAVEHVNSRLKDKRALNDLTVRRLRKVTVHCYLSLIAMQVQVSVGQCG